MGVLLALCGAAAYGLSDFFGGIGARRESAWVIAFTTSLSALPLTLLAASLLGGSPTTADLAWGAAAGLGNGFGTAFLYRGFAAGRMGVVGPISAVGAALVPVAAGLITGERPPLLVWGGILAGFPGIWLVSQEPGSLETSTADRSGVLDGVLAGLGFGSLFACLGQIPDSAGLLPLAANQAVALFVIPALALTAHGRWLPRSPTAAIGVACGVFSTLATVTFLWATHRGALSVSAVLASLYPAVTIALAAGFLGERVHRVQAVGLALCAVAVTLIALG